MKKQTQEEEPIILPTEVKRLRYDFTATEIYDLSMSLADKNIEYKRLEEEKKSAMGEFKAKMDLLNEHISRLSTNVHSGYEYREIVCHIEYNKPKGGIKVITREDTGTSWEEKMTNEDINLFTQI